MTEDSGLKVYCPRGREGGRYLITDTEEDSAQDRWKKPISKGMVSRR